MPKVYNYKLVFIVLLGYLSINSIAIAQHITNVKIKFDKKINIKDIHAHYNDGILLESIIDSFENNTLHLKKPFYAPYASIQVGDKSGASYTYFIDEKPITIGFFHNPKKNTISPESTNPIEIFDTTNNVISKELYKSRIKDGELISNIWKNPVSEITNNDSLRNLHIAAIKSLNESTMNVLKKYPDEYFSFYYFKSQVIDFTLGFIENDSTYYKILLDFLKNTFHSKYIETEEAKTIIQNLENKTHHHNITGKKAIDFLIKSIDGKQLYLNDLKDRYVLLDFWATWCPPCLKQIPEIKLLRDKFSTEQLEIIGISADRDSTSFAQCISDMKMNWTHIYDDKQEIIRLFGINSFPTIILINKAGTILYRSSGILNKENLSELILDN